LGSGQRYEILDGRLLRGVARFGLPLSVGMALHSLFNVVDMVIVGHLAEGGRALGVLALADLLSMLATVVAMGMSNAAVAVISRKVGEGDRQRATEACWRSLTLLAGIGIMLGLAAVLLARPVIVAMGAQGWLRDEATQYLRVIMGGTVTAFVLVHATSALRAAGHSYTPTLLLFGANSLNLLLAVLFVYGPDRSAPALLSWGPPVAEALGIPRMGVVGAAWATVVARGVACVPAVLLLGRDFSLPRLRTALPNAMESRQLASIAWPSSAQYAVRVAGSLVLLSVVGHAFTSAEDSSALSAMGVCVRLDTIALFIALGWGSAAATFVGQNLGAGQFERATRSGWYAAFISAGALLAIGVLFMVFSGQVTGLFTPDETVGPVSQRYLLIVGPSYAALGLAAALSCALAGAGETLVSLRIDAAVLFGFQTPLLLLLAGLFGLPLAGCFALVSAANFVSAGLYAFAFSRGRWQHRRVR